MINLKPNLEIKDFEQPSQSHEQFKLADFNGRTERYQVIADHIWNPDRLLVEGDQ
tara:strand:+ start:300 stop:464 length:165 start_codon:yes stop_codon:yes gene_type:complete